MNYRTYWNNWNDHLETDSLVEARRRFMDLLHGDGEGRIVMATIERFPNGGRRETAIYYGDAR